MQIRHIWHHLVGFLPVILIACTTVTSSVPNASRKPVLLGDVEKLHIGFTQKEEIIKQFGEPDKKITLETAKSLDYFLYFEAPLRSIPRLSLGFNPANGILESVSWDVRSGDPEQALNQVKIRYQDARLAETKTVWTNPHMESDEALLSDKDRGLTIIYKTSSGQVTGIEWGKRINQNR